jgi:hypothetical protein
MKDIKIRYEKYADFLDTIHNLDIGWPIRRGYPGLLAEWFIKFGGAH